MSSWKRITLDNGVKVTDNFDDISKSSISSEKIQKEIPAIADSFALNSLLKQTLDDNEIIDENSIRPYKNRIAFFVSSLNDKDFDVLTPDFDQMIIKDVVFEFQLCTDNFTILNKQTNASISSNYRNEFIPVLKSLESGLISRELYIIFQKLSGNRNQNENFYFNGKVAVSIFDFRLQDPKMFYKELKITPDILNEINSPPSDSECSTFYSFTNENVCTAPTKNVARYMSVIDGREKMWRCGERCRSIEKQSMEHRKAELPKTHIVEAKNEGLLTLSSDLFM